MTSLAECKKLIKRRLSSAGMCQTFWTQQEKLATNLFDFIIENPLVFVGKAREKKLFLKEMENFSSAQKSIEAIIKGDINKDIRGTKLELRKSYKTMEALVRGLSCEDADNFALSFLSGVQ